MVYELQKGTGWSWLSLSLCIIKPDCLASETFDSKGLNIFFQWGWDNDCSRVLWDDENSKGKILRKGEGERKALIKENMRQRSYLCLLLNTVLSYISSSVSCKNKKQYSFNNTKLLTMTGDWTHFLCTIKKSFDIVHMRMTSQACVAFWWIQGKPTKPLISHSTSQMTTVTSYVQPRQVFSELNADQCVGCRLFCGSDLWDFMQEFRNINCRPY